MEDLSHLRQSYEKSELPDAGLPAFPVDLFSAWFSEQKSHGNELEPNAMTISTLGLDGFPKARVVLLKSFDERGFVFFTNYESEKGRAIAADTNVCLSFFWPSMERQVIVKGIAEKIGAAESEAYFRSRPRGSQLGALASDQSRPVASRRALDERLDELGAAIGSGEVPMPDHWGGYLVRPVSVEFWQGRANRMHDRILYTWVDGQWTKVRLQP